MLGMVRMQLVCIVFHTLMTGKTGWAEILRIPLCSVYYTVPTIFPVPRIFIALDVQCGCFVRQGYVIENIVSCTYSSTAVVELRWPGTCTRCTSVISSCQSSTFTAACQCTRVTGLSDCAACSFAYWRPYCDFMKICTPSHIAWTSAATVAVTVANRTQTSGVRSYTGRDIAVGIAICYGLGCLGI
jgi:hypothetical protein